MIVHLLFSWNYLSKIVYSQIIFFFDFDNVYGYVRKAGYYCKNK